MSAANEIEALYSSAAENDCTCYSNPEGPCEFCSAWERAVSRSAEIIARASAQPNYVLLYTLVEAYLCTPNTSPAIEDHYNALVAWFVRNKRPDGSDPLPVSPEQ
jgi:hypothetical protein